MGQRAANLYTLATISLIIYYREHSEYVFISLLQLLYFVVIFPVCFVSVNVLSLQLFFQYVL